MSKECGTHEVHRTFKPSADASRGYVSLVMSSTVPASALHPKIRMTLHTEHGSEQNHGRLLATIVVLGRVLGTGLVINPSRALGDYSCAELEVVPPMNMSWPDLVNALCPRDPEALQRLDELFYLPMAA